MGVSGWTRDVMITWDTYYEDLNNPANMSTLLIPEITIRTVGVEDTSHANLDAILTVEAVSQGFGDTLALVVASTGANGVDVTPAKKCVSE